MWEFQNILHMCNENRKPEWAKNGLNCLKLYESTVIIIADKDIFTVNSIMESSETHTGQPL